MAKKFFVLKFLLLLLAFFHCSFIHGQQYENQIIERLDIVVMNLPEGTSFDTSAILSRMKTRVDSVFSQSDFDNDLKTLAQEFDRIDPILEYVKGKVFITLNIWPKPAIRNIIWEGNRKVLSKCLAKELDIPNGSLFDRLAFNQAFHKLKAYYVKQGFFEAELSYDVVPNATANQVDIHIHINEGRAGKIKNIYFSGFTKEEENEISELMVTKEYTFFLSWLTEEGLYHEDAMQHDELIILNYIQNKGYADARVAIDVLEANQNDRINIKINLERGPLYTMGAINVSGNTLFLHDDVIRCFTFNTGWPYSPENIRLTVDRLSDLYGRCGYIDAIIDFEPKPVGNECIYDIDFKIEEGKQYRVGLIKIFGNYCTQNSVILNETLLIPGEIFNSEKLKATEERLANIGFFKNVNVYAVKSEGPCGLGDNFRDVHIEVEETSTGQFGAFVGYSTSESLFGGFNITESNFNYKGLSTLFSKGLCSLRGGGEYAHFTTTIGTKSRSYILSWSKPYFNDSIWTVGFDIENSSNRYVSDDYAIESSGFTIRGIYQANAFVRVGCHYRFKYTRIDIEQSHPPRALRREARNTGVLSAFGMSWVYDSTNSPLFPTKGFKSRVEGELAGAGGHHAFFSAGYINSYYWRFKDMDSQGVWRARADFRYIVPLWNTTAHTVPIDERFFLGGDTEVRGYRPYKLGPQYKDGDPRGGISMQYLSLEYARPLYFKRVQGFLFIDAGALTSKIAAMGRLFTSVGWGLRLAIFPNAPPLTLGLGYPLNPRSRGDVKRFFLNVGGRF